MAVMDVLLQSFPLAIAQTDSGEWPVDYAERNQRIPKSCKDRLRELTAALIEDAAANAAELMAVDIEDDDHDDDFASDSESEDDDEEEAMGAAGGQHPFVPERHDAEQHNGQPARAV